MNLEINTDSFAVKAQIEADIKRVLPVLSQQILQDCNYFCKQDQGGLIASSQTASNFEEGTLIWNTVYAVMQYYLGATSLCPFRRGLGDAAAKIAGGGIAWNRRPHF